VNESIMTIHQPPANVNHNSLNVEVSLPTETTELLQLGCKLFPCRPDTKRPAIGGWQEAATDDPVQLLEWLKQGWLLGIYCAGSGFVGLDVDLKNDPQAWEWTYNWLSNAGFTGFDKPLQFSRSKAPHYAFRTPPDWEPRAHKGIRTFKISDFRALEPDEADKEIFSIRNRGLLIAAGSVVEGLKYKLPPEPTIHEWLPAISEALGHGSVIEAPTHNAEAGLQNCTFEEVDRAIDILLPTGAFDVEEDWTQAIWRIKRSLGAAGWPLVEKISYADDEDLRLTKWNNERSSVPDPYGALTIIKAAERVLKGNGLSDPIIAAAAQRYNGAVAKQKAVEGMKGVAQLVKTDSAPIATAATSAAPNALPLPPTAEQIAAEQAAAIDAAHEEEFPTPAGGFILTSEKFTAGHRPPDYLIRPVIQRRYCYSITAGTGGGKTTVAMLLAAHVGIGKPIDANVTCKPGTVIYFAGENPDDCRTRWLGLTRDMGINPNSVDVHFIDGALHLSKVKERITAEIEAKKLAPALIIIDTSMAFFEGEDPNNNREQLEHARRMRSLCALPSGPCVLILCHPVKNASDDNLKPYGGGSFINEVDGNISLKKSADGKMVGMETDPDKFRGARFSPLNFQLVTIWDHPEIVDSDGLPMPTVVARPISAGEVERAEAKASKDEDKVLKVLCDGTPMIVADLAKAMAWGWVKTDRLLKRLEEEGLATVTKKLWSATPKGQKYLNALATAQPIVEAPPLAPANLGSAPYPLPTRSVTPHPMPPQSSE
jgi:AAA domain-containing protein/bifunctional DNA primase/polymerase-like protein